MRRLLLLGVFAALTATARAGEIPFRGAGARVSALGDLDGDGKPEFAVATRGSKAAVSVVSTATGRELWSADGHDAAAVPDQDGDGKPDVVVAVGFADAPAWLAVCKGVDGGRIATVAPPKDKDVKSPIYDSGPAFSEAVVLVGDADGDGKHDFLVIRALPARPKGGRGMAALLQPWCESATAFVVGLDGKVIADLSPRVDPDWRSPLAAPAADVDGDGRADVFVEVAYEEGKLPLEVRSLAKGAVLKFKGDAVSGPQSIAVCGDIDGDKKPDFLFGRTSSVRKEFHGEVRVVSGKDGHAIRSVTGFKQGDRLGASVAAMPDVDGDGVPDFAAGAPGMEPKKELSDAGGVVAFSGKSGKVLWTVKGDGAFGSLGESIALVGDVDGDGVPELVAGAPGFGPDDKGRALVLSGKTGKTLLTFAGK